MAGIYVHFPFCKKKCAYCAFYSINREDLWQPYFSALKREMDLRREFLGGETISTLYFGGGTPSLCPVPEWNSILQKLNSVFHFDSNLEFTMEANPDQLNRNYLKELKSLGVNRLSIGVQSFDDDVLKMLGRSHDAQTACRAIETAFDVGFENVSIDLIYGISARNPNQWRDEVTLACRFPITHLSAYSLTVEENTLLNVKIRNGQMPPLDDNVSISDFETLLEVVRSQGFRQYEISNFERNGHISKHNFSYWTNVPYLGLGPSAHSYDGKMRTWNVADVREYIKSIENGSVCFDYERLSLQDKYNEYVLLRLRTCFGVDLLELEQLFGTDRRRKVEEYFRKSDESLYVRDNNKLILSDRGKIKADGIAEDLFEITDETH